STSRLSSPLSTLQGGDSNNNNAGTGSSKQKQPSRTSTSSTGENIGLLAHATTARRDSEQQKGGDGADGRGGGSAGAAGTEPPATPDDIGFNVLTVSDEKWTSPDLPPEAGKQQQHQQQHHQQKRTHGGGSSSTGGGSVGGGSTRPGGGGGGGGGGVRGQGKRKSTGVNPMSSSLLQQTGSSSLQRTSRRM
ncbi:unnamed protein product, partial [Laminaria digitata]